MSSASRPAAVCFLRASPGSPAMTRPRPAQARSHLREPSRVLTAPAQAPRSPGCRCLTARRQAASWLVAGTRVCARPGAAARGCCCVFAFPPGSPGRFGKPSRVLCFLSSLHSSLPVPIPCRHSLPTVNSLLTWESFFHLYILQSHDEYSKKCSANIDSHDKISSHQQPRLAPWVPLEQGCAPLLSSRLKLGDSARQARTTFSGQRIEINLALGPMVSNSKGNRI